MEIITKDEFYIREQELIELIENDAIFIHPTDTIYGLGCNALSEKAVEKIRELKGRPKTPFSVIAPSKDWINENCVLSKNAKEWVDKLPGPYTLILKLKNKSAVAKNIAPGNDTIGVRIPDHWIRAIVRYIKIPIVTTSVNKVGKEFMVSIDNLDPEIKVGAAFMIDEGEKKGRPSKIIDLTKEKVEITER